MLLLLACTGAVDDTAAPNDTADTADSGDTGDTDVPGAALADAHATFTGAPSTAAGSAVAGAGDLDGDGLADVLVAAFYGNRVCAAYGPIAAGDRALADGACLEGEAVYDFAGYAAAAAPIGGPGFAVTAIGEDSAGIEAGKVYFWRGAPPAGTTPLGAAPVAWVGEAAGDYAGTSVAYGGDLDGDGVPELLVGASGADAGGNGAGRVYVVDVPEADGVYSLADAATTFTGSSSSAPAALFHGAATGGDAIGESVAGAGDLDGDGFDDLVLGGGGSDAAGDDAGEIWVVRGPVAGGDFRAADADARLFGPGPGAYAGAALTAPGDLDGDGLADLALAADGWENGTIYVYFGPVTDGEASLGDAPVALVGEAEEDFVGWSLSGAGDTDGDGVRELLLGAPGWDGAGGDGGGAYLVREPATLGRRSLGEAALRWDAEAAGDAAGRAVAGVGDTDGDGLDDLLVGALYNQAGGVFGGRAYLLLGR